MKKFKTLLILCVLVVFPAISWVFLKYGLEWRKEAVANLTPKADISALAVNSGAFITQDEVRNLFIGKTTLLDLTGQSESPRLIEINDQFQTSNTFQYVAFHQSNEARENSDIAPDNHLSMYDDEFENVKSYFKDADFVIIDTSGAVRQYYQGINEKVYNAIIEDLAVVIPRKKPKDIGIRKSDQ